MAQNQSGGFVFTPPQAATPEPSLFDRFMEKFTSPTMSPETVNEIQRSGPQETSNFLEDLSKNVLGETVTSFLPLTAPKRQGFLAGAAESLSRPSTMAQIASTTPLAAIAAPANAAIAAHGAGQAMDEDLPLFQNPLTGPSRIMGGVDALTGGAGAALGARQALGGVRSATPTTSTVAHPPASGPMDLMPEVAAAIEKKYPLQPPKNRHGVSTGTIPVVSPKIKAALEQEFGLPEDPMTRVYQGKTGTPMSRTAEMNRLKAELAANTPTDIPAESPNIVKQAKGQVDAEKTFTKLTDELASADQIAADKNAAEAAGATWSEPSVTVKTAVKDGGTTQTSTRKLEVQKNPEGVEMEDLDLFGGEGGNASTGAAPKSPKGAPPAGTSPLPKGVKRFYGSQQAAMLQAKNHNLQVVGHPDGTFEIIPFSPSGKATAAPSVETPAASATPEVPAEVPTVTPTPEADLPIDPTVYKTKAYAVGAAKKQGLPASLASDNFIEPVEGGFRVNPNRKGSQTGPEYGSPEMLARLSAKGREQVGAAPIVSQAEPVPAAAAAETAADIADVNPESRPGKFTPPKISPETQAGFDRRHEDLMKKFGFTGGRRQLDARPSFPSETDPTPEAPKTPETPPAAPKAEPTLREKGEEAFKQGQARGREKYKDEIAAAMNPQPKAQTPDLASVKAQTAKNLEEMGDVEGAASYRTPTPKAQPQGAAPIVDQPRAELDAIVQAEVDAGNRYGELKRLKAQGKATEEEVRAAGKAAQQARIAAAGALQKAKEVALPTPEPKPVASVAKDGPTFELGYGDDLKALASLDPQTRLKAIQAMIEAEATPKRNPESGAAQIMPVARMAGGLGGAAYGAATGEDPQERIMRALLYGAGGAAAPDLLRNLPDAQRAFLLARWPNLAINALAGPYGSTVMGSLEHAISDLPSIKKIADNPLLEGGNDLLPAQGAGIVDAPWATQSLRNSADPIRFLKGWWDAKDEAGRLAGESLERGEVSPGIAEAPAIVRKALQAPGQSMTMGDISGRENMMSAGAPEEIARAATMTDEPSMAFPEKIVNLKRGRYSMPMDVMMPFVRTLMNQVEGTIERAPLLGVIAQYRAKGGVGPDPQNLIVAQQILGTGVPFATAMLGMQIPPGLVQTPVMTKLLSNMGGQYGGLAVAGFMLGQGLQMGKPYLEAARDAGLSILQSAPLPTLEPATDILNFATRGEIPSAAQNPLVGSVIDSLMSEEQPTPPSSFVFEPPQ